MLDHLAEAERAGRLMRAIEDVCREGPRTRDLGDDAATTDVGDAVAARLS